MNANVKRHPLVNQQAAETLADPRWALIVARDASRDGEFYYSVSSTGVYCKPSCASRLAKPENVAFHDSIAAAEKAGFRACKRCKPDQPDLSQQHAEIVTRACRIIETAESLPSLDALAQQLGVSTYHFHRLFKASTGLTPKQYAAAHRTQRVRGGLDKGDKVTDAIFDAGFNASSRFYATSNAALGMTPQRYRKGGSDAQIRFAIGECSLGAILVAHSGKGVCAILLDDDPDVLLRDLQDRFPKAKLIGGDGDFEKLVAQVVGFVDKPTLGLDLPLDVRGTAFQQRVWEALRKIPVGATASYADIAERIGAPKAVRAVAAACAANAIAVAIPCHRVVRTDGGLSGYRWGVERKRVLMERESQ